MKKDVLLRTFNCNESVTLFGVEKFYCPGFHAASYYCSIFSRIDSTAIALNEFDVSFLPSSHPISFERESRHPLAFLIFPFPSEISVFNYSYTNPTGLLSQT
jgi:hypothetical protein